MHILLTLSHFGLGGTETYSTTVAEGLEALGHRVTIYAPEASALGREMASARGLELYAGEILPVGVDAAIAQDTASAQLLAAREPAPRQLFAMHGLAPFEQPPPGLDPAPRVVVFNDRTRRHAAALAESPPVVRLRQPIDVTRFRPRSAASPRARRLLLLTNALGPGRLGMLEEACADLGLELVRVGATSTPSTDPQEAIAVADIVVGYGRSVLEGMAMGRPAYVWERGGGDGWVTPESYAAIEAEGFSGAGTDDVIDADRLRADLADYRPELGELGFELVRKHHSAARHVEALAELLAAGVAPVRQDSAETISLLVRAEKRAVARAEGAEAAHGVALTYIPTLPAEIEALRGRVIDAEGRLEVERHAVGEERREREVAEAALREELAAVLGSSSWRLTAPLRRLGAKLRTLLP